MAQSPSLKLNDDKTILEIAWDANHKTRRHVKWLRFQCRCKRCLPVYSGQFLVDKLKFEGDLHITKTDIQDGVLRISLDKEMYGDHVTTMPLDWLKNNCNCEECLKSAITRSDLRFRKTMQLPRVQYDTLESMEGKFQCLSKFFDVGFCIIDGVPIEELTVLKVGEMFSFIRSTLYGKHFDVKYELDPNNAAYTSTKLPYHQDLPFYEGMPGVQLLHAMEFDDSIEGGDSQLIDLFKVAEILRQESPEDFQALCRIPATFQTIDLKRSLPAWFESAKTHIEVDYFGNIVSIFWNPSVEGTLKVRPEDEGPYYKAYTHFLRILEREAEFAFRLKVGELLIFNNRRMGHARKAFDKAEGRRRLQGCYLNLDDMKSTYMVLAQQLGKQVDPPRCGNRSWF